MPVPHFFYHRVPFRSDTVGTSSGSVVGAMATCCSLLLAAWEMGLEVQPALFLRAGFAFSCSWPPWSCPGSGGSLTLPSVVAVAKNPNWKWDKWH